MDRQIHYGTPIDAKSTDKLIRIRHEYLWHLTVQGAKYLDSRTELSLPNIRFPKRPKQYLSNDYHHRVSTISMHLSFERWMQQISNDSYQFMTYYKQYKTTNSKRFEAETRLQFKDKTHYTPDAFFWLLHYSRWTRPYFCFGSV